MTPRTLIPALLLALCSVAQAGPIECLPRPLGSGTSALVKRTPAGQFAAWKCNGSINVVVCEKRTCGLVATQEAIAKWASDATLDGLRAAITSTGRDPFSDPLLTAVWHPYRAQIEALK